MSIAPYLGEHAHGSSCIWRTHDKRRRLKTRVVGGACTPENNLDYVERKSRRGTFSSAIKGKALKSVPALSGYFSTPEGLRFHRALLNLNSDFTPNSS
jgi:hypothetical protein